MISKGTQFLRYIYIIIFCLTFPIQGEKIVAEEPGSKEVTDATTNTFQFLKGFGIKTGISYSFINLFNHVVPSSGRKYIPHFSIFIDFIALKNFFQQLELYYCKPNRISVAKSLHFLNLDYNLSFHLKTKIQPFISPGLNLGFYLGSNLDLDKYERDNFLKPICFGFNISFGLKVVFSKIEPSFEFKRFRYLTPFYQSENNGNYIAVKHRILGNYLCLGLLYKL